MFRMNLCGMKSIRSFKQAQEYWTDAKSWRNKHTSWRPLQNERKEHVRMVRIDGNGGGYECVLYQTPMVTYYASGDIKLIGDNRSASHEFAWHTTPAGVTPTSANGKMYWQVDTPEGTRYYRDDKYLMLTPVPNGKWELANEPIVEEEKTLDLKKAAAVRKTLSHYDKWDKMTSRLMGAWDQKYPRYPQRHDIRVLLEHPEDLEMFTRLRSELGPVSGFREAAYDIMGAYDEVTVPHDRLPRKAK